METFTLRDNLVIKNIHGTRSFFATFQDFASLAKNHHFSWHGGSPPRKYVVQIPQRQGKLRIISRDMLDRDADQEFSNQEAFIFVFTGNDQKQPY